MTGSSSSLHSNDTQKSKIGDNEEFEDSEDSKKNINNASDESLLADVIPVEMSIGPTRSTCDRLISQSILMGAGRTQAAFVNKLYRMLEDQEFEFLITWSNAGDLFSVSNPTQFSKTVLPQYFKHNNWQSFVRQLNMYGFHKVNDMAHSNLVNDIQTWEFSHPHFRKGGIEDLQLIKRKSTKSQPRLSSPDCTQTLESSDYDETHEDLRSHLINMEEQVLDISKTCDTLFKEVTDLKTIVLMQQEMLQELVDNLKGSTSPRSDLAGRHLKATCPQTSPENQPRQPLFGSNESPVWSMDMPERRPSAVRQDNTSPSSVLDQLALPSINTLRNMKIVSTDDLKQKDEDYRMNTHELGDAANSSRIMVPVNVLQTKNPSGNPRDKFSTMSSQTDLEGSEGNNPSNEVQSRFVALMGFGKESHLLNPESGEGISDESDHKRRRKNINNS